MRISTLAVLMIITTVVLSSCSSQQAAEVEDKGSRSYSTRMQNRMSYVSLETNQAASTPVVESKSLSAPGKTVSAATSNTVVRSKNSPFMTQAESKMASDKVLQSIASSRWQWPVTGKVIQAFGPQRDGVASQGITIAAAEGDPIRAAQGGEVAYVGQNVRDYGNMVILRHADGALSSYSHARTITVTKGQQVTAGTVLGFVGQSGGAKMPQLHFAVREGSKAVDPLSKLPHDMAGN